MTVGCAQCADAAMLPAVGRAEVSESDELLLGPLAVLMPLAVGRAESIDCLV